MPGSEELSLLYVVAAGLITIMHLGRNKFDRIVLMVMLLIGTAGFAFCFYIATGYDHLPYRDVVALTGLYAIYLFILASELMLWGLAEMLTRWRGDNWTKEIDYFYLLLAGVGLTVSVNRLEIVHDKVSFPDVYGPMILSTALVLRAIKARAEINGWNKLP